MDLVTHSIVSLSFAESVVQFRRYRKAETSPKMNTMLWATGLAAGLLPDIDAVYSLFLGDRLGYLLHRRGYTHTLLGVIPEMVFMVGLIWFFGRWVKYEFKRKDWVWLGLISLFCILFHLLIDWLNSYGAHFLWPFDKGWVYGDSLFIMEPWLWMFLLPLLFLSDSRSILRVFFAGLFIFALVAVWFFGFVPWFMALSVMLSGLGFWKLSRKWSPGFRVASGLVLSALIVWLFAGVSVFIKNDVHFILNTSDPNIQINDIVLSPYPANPFCWMLLSVETLEGGKTYRVRKGVYTPLPSLVDAPKCPTFWLSPGTINLLPSQPSTSPNLLWAGEYCASVESLKTLFFEHCYAAAYFRWSRVPFVKEDAGDFIFGDLRYDRNRGLDFAEVQVRKVPSSCPIWVPEWEEPRRELFAP